jgi:adenylate kinase family enzyme
VRRVTVVGNSGAGKTTVGRALARMLDAPFVELDAIFHQPGWEPLPADEFRRRVAEVVAGERWVVDGNYSAVRDLVWQRADTVVWLDPPRRTVMRQLIARTLRRLVTRQPLWNGNREPLTGVFRLDPMRSIIRWAWTRHHTYQERYAALAADSAYRHLRFVRVRTRADVARLLR